MRASRPHALHRWWLVVGSLWLALPGVAVAQEEWTEPAPYILLGAINSFEHFQDTGENDFGNSWGFSVRGGYRFNEFLAVEGFLEFLSGYEVDYLVEPPLLPQPTDVSLTVDGGMGGASVKLYAPWFGRIQPYGLAGIGGQWAQLRTTNATGIVCDPFFWYCTGTYTQLGNAGAFVSKFGGGVELWLNEDLALVVDAIFNLPTGDLKDLRSTNLTWGAVFRF